MKKYQIAVIPGDGTGPEVVREGLKVLQVTSKNITFPMKQLSSPLVVTIIKRPVKPFLLRMLKN